MKTERSAISFQSNDEFLNAGFAWAKEQALFYAHDGEDAVGLWYEAALPSREAFCMRDISHQSLGAAALGLQAHTRNMMQKFAENISESKDYCTYWEIDKDDQPAPVDYESDEDFWYNLPANFDVIEACWRQYLWTGDRFYLEHPAMRRFYDLSVTAYVERWDKDGDGIPEYYPEYGRRGLASYNEVGEFPRIGADLIAIMIAGYKAYAEMMRLEGKEDEHAAYAAKADDLQKLLNERWWDEANNSFYVALGHDGQFLNSEAGEGQFLPLYYEAITDSAKRESALIEAIAKGVSNVEGMSYLPEMYYRAGYDEQALISLKALMEPELERREYPEVSYSAIGAIVSGLMGISADGVSGIATASGLAGGVGQAELTGLPVIGRTIGVKHEDHRSTALTLMSGETIVWKVKFPAEAAGSLKHNGASIEAGWEQDGLGRGYRTAEITVGLGETHIVSVD
ncbi:hypothetical protein [Paenibacillus sp. NPDC058071]|uniref:MGH1-like glycoside hydrolase domain-containing protein n=1 Tax=Paenibacillus sp. NPDC058071 TaxID=3346326 RepID=UPI0036DC6087